ncbi:hypothetical protein D3X11_01685 [Streptococcus sp. X16XC17]|uniref:hypothetical protein n=1 Tax=unclassified Streptococcus TaxID=2608887 RepID=UPI00066FFC88|nr:MULTISPECIES: hypothetical protein [unclassified Streptococcus]TCD46194.1 hypothetical protein D3X11_01685 [Streptococcus sp. X16XC17]
MKKNIYYLAGLGLSLLALTACSSTDSKSTKSEKPEITSSLNAVNNHQEIRTEQFVADSGRFSVQAPKGWSQQNNPEKIVTSPKNSIALESPLKDAYFFCPSIFKKRHPTQLGRIRDLRFKKLTNK